MTINTLISQKDISIDNSCTNLPDQALRYIFKLFSILRGCVRKKRCDNSGLVLVVLKENINCVKFLEIFKLIRSVLC